MKEYEACYNYKLPWHFPVILRLDGKAFHTYSRQFPEKPFDSTLERMMNETALFLCKEIQNTQMAYVQSDEISILLHNYKTINTQSWFGNELQKMISISAGMASAYFTQLHRNNLGNERVVLFDSRAFILPECEVTNYFIWRQKDWERNSIQMLARSLFSQKKLYKKNIKQLNQMIFEKGINWNDLPVDRKRGRCILKKDRKWICDKDIPIFTEDREYIEQFLSVE